MTDITVIIADDHPITRAGIRRFLEKAPDIKVIAEAEDGELALQLTRELVPDVLLLDMEMPGLKGLEVAKALKGSDLSTRILALSTYDQKQYIFGLLANGAAGYLTKEE
ncbi:MAG TPA: response regulator transcription factor, partial [Anaerolineales bacterium]|nr:response regulator transcription factor [Anaerolineales bacterium]